MFNKISKFHAVLALLVCFTTAASAGEMTDLGTLGDNYSTARAISDSGGVIVGYSTTGGLYRAFSYSNTTMSNLGTLGGVSSYAYGVSGDGSVVVGDSYIAGNSAHHAFKYTGTTMTDLGTLGGSSSYARDASLDGSVIVGYSAIAGNTTGHAFKYTGGTMTDLGTLGGSHSYAYGVSSDGSVIVGNSETTGNAAYHAFKYTGTTMTDLGTLGGNHSYAEGVSSDGSVIVGYSYVTGDSTVHAFKYTGTTMTDLGMLGGSNSFAYGVSSDGSVIVGKSSTSGDAANHAFKYTGTTMTDLGTLGGTDSCAYGVSSDGSVIVGDSNIAGDTATHAFVYRSAMVDADNTRLAIVENAAQMNSLLNLKSALLVNALDSDCAQYGESGACLALSGWHYSGQEDKLAAQSASTLKASYRFNGNFRAGFLMDFSYSQTNPDNFHVNRTPLVGVFAVLGDNESGLGAQLKLSMAYNEAATNITRTVLTNTEAGNGDSAFNSFGMKAELGYGKDISGWTALPYVGLQWTNVSRDGYIEASGATFPVDYNSIASKQFTLLAGVKAERALTKKFGVGGGIGVEQDLHSSMGAYNGTMDTLGSFNLEAPNVTNTRPYAGVSASYDLGKGQRIGAGLDVRRQPIGTTYATLVSGQYGIAF